MKLDVAAAAAVHMAAGLEMQVPKDGNISGEHDTAADQRQGTCSDSSRPTAGHLQ
jgi:hypothetical protein